MTASAALAIVERREPVGVFMNEDDLYISSVLDLTGTI